VAVTYTEASWELVILGPLGLKNFDNPQVPAEVRRGLLQRALVAAPAPAQLAHDLPPGTGTGQRWLETELRAVLAASDLPDNGPGGHRDVLLRLLGLSPAPPAADDDEVVRHQGRHRRRCREHPEEQRFAAAWESINAEPGCPGTHTLSYLLGDGCQQVQLTAREAQVAASVVQWLGSPVGQAFLRDLGYEKSATPKGSSVREA
jgi:hypothetical protein